MIWYIFQIFSFSKSCNFYLLPSPWDSLIWRFILEQMVLVAQAGLGLSLSPSEKFKHKPWLHNCFNYLGSKWSQPHQVLQKSSFRALTHHYIPNLRSNRTLLLYFRFHFRQYPFHLRQGRLWKIAIFLIQSHEAESRWNLLTTSHTVCQTIKYSAKQKAIT